jgi:hypothetical protein
MWQVDDIVVGDPEQELVKLKAAAAEAGERYKSAREAYLAAEKAYQQTQKLVLDADRAMRDHEQRYNPAPPQQYVTLRTDVDADTNFNWRPVTYQGMPLLVDAAMPTYGRITGMATNLNVADEIGNQQVNYWATMLETARQREAVIAQGVQRDMEQAQARLETRRQEAANFRRFVGTLFDNDNPFARFGRR